MKTKSHTLIKPGHVVKLDKLATDFSGSYIHEEQAKKELDRHVEQLGELQELLFAEGKHAVLIVLQGMDTAGKDGTIRHIFTGVNPQGCNVSAFKTPTPEELSHDFLWRVHRCTPRKGMIQIFNRSHYEDVLVTRVHGQVSDKIAHQRMKQIVDFERMLVANGTLILKFFLHISEEEQATRLQARLDDTEKQWKISSADFAERKFWSKYQKAYEDAIERTSTSFAPWYVIPSNHKWYRNVAISKILVEALDGLGMKYPGPPPDIGKLHL